MPIQLQQEQLWALHRSEGWRLLVEKLQSQKSLRQRAINRAIENNDLNAAIREEASFKLIEWVIELPHQLIKEFGNSGDTKKSEE